MNEKKQTFPPSPAGAPIEWYTRLATMALEAIEGGSNAALLMNLDGIKEHLRAAKDGKWPAWAGMPANTDAGSGAPAPISHAELAGRGLDYELREQAAENAQMSASAGVNDKPYFCPNCGVGTGCHHHSWCNRQRNAVAGVVDAHAMRDALMELLTVCAAGDGLTEATIRDADALEAHMLASIDSINRAIAKARAALASSPRRLPAFFDGWTPESVEGLCRSLDAIGAPGGNKAAVVAASKLRKMLEGIPPSGTPSDWVDQNVSGNPTLMQAMKNIAENAAKDVKKQ